MILAEEALKKRWRERSIKYHALEIVEQEEQKHKNIEERVRITKLKEANDIARGQRHLAVEMNEHCYNTLAQNHMVEDDSSLLLDAVITPVSESSCIFEDSCTLQELHSRQQVQSARAERDRALALACKYRDDVEKSRMERRALKHDLETKIETVRNFWRNKIIEGSSRSGRILRAALIRQ